MTDLYRQDKSSNWLTADPDPLLLLLGGSTMLRLYRMFYNLQRNREGARERVLFSEIILAWSTSLILTVSPSLHALSFSSLVLLLLVRVPTLAHYFHVYSWLYHHSASIDPSGLCRNEDTCFLLQIRDYFSLVCQSNQKGVSLSDCNHLGYWLPTLGLDEYRRLANKKAIATLVPYGAEK